MIIDVLTVIGIGITFLKSLYPMIIGRLIWGFSAGAFSVVCPMFITEISPSSLTGPFGVITQFNITLGILISYIVGNFVIPLVDTPEILTSGNWRIVYGFPIIIVVIHVLLLSLIFRSDSPKYYALKGDKDSIRKFQKLVYYETDDKDIDLIDDSK